MTDFEKWTQFLDSFEIGYDVDSISSEKCIVLRAGHEKTKGSFRLATIICFDSSSENFKHIVLYE